MVCTVYVLGVANTFHKCGLVSIIMAIYLSILCLNKEFRYYPSHFRSDETAENQKKGVENFLLVQKKF